MPVPNLFDFATSELSQDAFVCWLAAWADPACRELDGPLHATATAFLDRLLEVGGGPTVPEYRSVEVRQQWNHIDVLLLVNGDTAVIIEDKTDSADHSDQLKRYKKAVADACPDHRIAAVYLKTGDQCDFTGATQAGYGYFLRPDFLDILGRGESSGVTNAVFADFHRYLRGIEDDVRSFPAVPFKDWSRKQWIGFFTALRERLGDGEWEVRGHAGGGSLPFRWHRHGDKFLVLNEGELCFKVEVKHAAQRGAEWAEWNRMLVARSGTTGITVATPRRKLGTRMTVAVLDGDYRRTDAAGRLDLDRTVDVLRGAEALMDAALAAGRSTPPPSAEGEAAAPRDAEAGAKIDALLRFLPVFEAADADHGEWRLAGGVMPYLVTSDAVTEFVDALYGNGWVEPFDWGAWQETAAGYAGSPERVATADIDTIRKLLTTHVRKDRFCEGHLVAMIASGHIAAVLRRLRDLRGPAK